jgi:adenylosuccinate synthase
MAATALIGLQWGDEGKGKIVDALAARADVVVRCNGGSNAGHTVMVSGDRFVLHLIPGGILQPKTACVIGNGVVVDPAQLVTEVRELECRGIQVSGRLLVSDRAHVVLPHHRLLDAALEADRAEGRIGTTGRGVGPAYADKAARTGIRVADLLDTDTLAAKVSALHRAKKRVLDSYGAGEALSEPDALVEKLKDDALVIRPFVADTVAYLLESARKGREIFLEGAQGSLLDVDLGTYPFVTSSNASIGGLITGSGLPARAVTRVIGVAKAYTTRVGAGPFPTEDEGEIGKKLRERGNEFGSTTGRPRRCGWFDAVASKFAVDVNGVDAIALTKVDVMAGLPQVKVCTAYKIGGVPSGAVPARNESLLVAEPVYETLPGWGAVSGETTAFDALPRELSSYIAFLERVLEAPVAILSLGPGRESLLQRPLESLV